MFKFDFQPILCRSGVLSSLPKIAVGFCPVAFCPVGFCPSGVLSQWGFVRSPYKECNFKDLYKENNENHVYFIKQAILQKISHIYNILCIILICIWHDKTTYISCHLIQ